MTSNGGSNGGLPPKRWQQISAPTERVMLDGIRAIVAISVVVSLTVLGLNNVVDAAAVTGVLGTVVGAFGASAAAATASRAASRVDSDKQHERPPVQETAV